jgi:hypothetical protein
MKGPQGMKVVQLEALDESAVEQAGCRTSGGATPTDDRLIAGALKACDRFDRGARPR